jgi:hypothetical protein
VRNLRALADPPVMHWCPLDLEAKWTPPLLSSEISESYAEGLPREHFTCSIAETHVPGDGHGQQLLVVPDTPARAS